MPRPPCLPLARSSLTMSSTKFPGFSSAMTANSLTRICFSGAEDDLLAHGWPRMARLVDGHPHDKSPAKSAQAWIGSIDPKKYVAEWPREVAYRVLRAGPVVQFAKSSYPSNLLTKKTKAA